MRPEYRICYEAKNRERINARMREWFAKHPEQREKRRLRCKQYYQLHRDRLREHQRQISRDKCTCGQLKSKAASACWTCFTSSLKPEIIPDVLWVDGEECRYIALGKGLRTLVDAKWYGVLIKYGWCTHYDHKGKRHYVVTGTGLKMHRLILGLEDPAIQCDHRNGDSLDNRESNLRACTASQNNANSKTLRIDNTTGYRGVRQVQSGRWIAKIRVKNKDLHIGTFDSPIDAAKARDEAAIQHFGEFAKLNFPLKGQVA